MSLEVDHAKEAQRLAERTGALSRMRVFIGRGHPAYLCTSWRASTVYATLHSRKDAPELFSCGPGAKASMASCSWFR